MKATIDDKAPVVAVGEIDIDAPAGEVWDMITDIDRWPEWNPDVKSARLEGELTPGSEFKWKAGPGTIRSRLVEVDPGRSIAWTGRTMGISAVHVWRLQPTTTGTRLVTEESWDGLPARLFRSSSQKTLDTSIQTGLAAIKAAVESRR